MQQSSLAFLALLAAATDAAHLGARAPAPAMCSSLNACYARFTQSSPASAYCSSFLGTTTKSTTTKQTLTASTSVVTKIVTVRGTTTVPQTSIVDATASYVTSYQSCTLAAPALDSSSSSSPGTSIFAAKRQATPLDAPGCLQYLVATGAAATTTACSCIASPATSVVTLTKTITPKVSKYTWTGTVSLRSTVRPITVVTNSPTYTVVMDPLPCVLSDATASTDATSSSTLTTTISSSTSTTMTATSSSTPTPTSATPPALCNNQGLQWELFSNIPTYWSANYWQNFDGFLRTAKTTTPNLSGVTTTLGGLVFSSAPTITIYNNTTPFNNPFFTLEHHGYIFATQTGQYTVNLGIADDFLAAWAGPNAVSGWTFSNSNALSNLQLPAASFTYNMTAGQYYPLRFVFANAYQGGHYSMSIINPDGTTLTTSAEQGNPALVQFSCDGTTAPALGDWKSSGSV